MAIEIKIIPAVILYTLYLTGVVIFAISPALADHNGLIVAGVAVVLGLIAYASQDFTTMAIIKERSISLTLIDVMGGVLVIFLSAAGGFYAAQIFAGN